MGLIVFRCLGQCVAAACLTPKQRIHWLKWGGLASPISGSSLFTFEHRSRHWLVSVCDPTLTSLVPYAFLSLTISTIYDTTPASFTTPSTC
ncbi:hypothetical protein DAEQUDRAFT_531550 [Daedalea quercina L-15889]|uniref:Secreted protein n=1 Tax=Daedalea quercina L-15889 TaxID=1314783 RepID=A0A165M8T4_9APHY|nr:hypothetical protein DAEQUDRAFT_531550 [Daedalea quercina L-15889]